MKKFLPLFLCCLLGTAVAKAQTVCGTHNLTLEQEMVRLARVDSLHQHRPSQRVMEDGIQYIAIKMHLFGTPQNSVADHGDINRAIAQLNREFAPLNIAFYFSGSSFNEYINNAFYAGQQSAAADFAYFNQYGANDAINCYVQGLVWSQGSIVNGISPIDPEENFSNRLYISKNVFDDGITTVHEFCHYFGLQHTFNMSTTEDVTAREFVTRNFDEVPPRLSANCDVAGDFVCDTPADPYPLDMATGCDYTSQITDVNGDLFVPMTNNYMSYRWCSPYALTSGQLERISQSGVIVNGGGTDFTFDAPETVQPAPTNLQLTTPEGSFETLSWTHDSEMETGYFIERSASADGPFVTIGGVAENTFAFHNLGLSVETPSYFRVKPSNTKATYSAVIGPFFQQFPCGNEAGQNCNGNAADWIIDEFAILDNESELLINTGTGCEPGGLGNYYETHSAQVMQGQTLQFRVRAPENEAGQSFEIAARIYADWNHNLTFEESELLHMNGETTFHEYNGSFTIPADVVPGEYRLRVLESAYSDIMGACYANYGEIEDYKLIVVPLETPDYDRLEFSLFPNPASAMVELRASQIIDRILLTDVSGKVVLDQEGGNFLNVAALSQGLYLVTVFSGSFRQTQKLVRR